MKSVSITRSLLCASGIVVALTFTAVSTHAQTQNRDKPSQRVTHSSASPSSVAAAAAANQQPVAFSTAFGLGPGAASTTGCTGCAALGEVSAVYTVPQGQQLVIQQLMATAENTDFTQQHTSAFVIINNGPGTTTLPIVLTEQTQYSDLNVIGTVINAFGGSQQVIIYVPAGQTVQFGGSRGDSRGSTFFSFFFYGYLVPAP